MQERLNRIRGFVLYGMAVYFDMKPSVQAASTRLCCEIIIHFVFTLPEPLPRASYCMLFCSSAVTTAYFTALLSTRCSAVAHKLWMTPAGSDIPARDAGYGRERGAHIPHQRTWNAGATKRKLMICAGIQYPQLLATVAV